MTKRMWIGGTVAGMCLAVLGGAARAKAQAQPAMKDVVNTMIAHELDEAAHKRLYSYLSVEKSDRTGGHFWTEHVVETPVGRVRFVIAEDGRPLSGDRMGRERGRLADDIAHPEEFEAREKAQKDDEAHARQMMELLPKAFILENMREQGMDWRIDFRPDPNYSPSGMEEKVLHAMSGYLLIDRKELRLHHIEGRMPQDLSMEFGLVTVQAGSNFESDKAPVEGHWRTVRVVSDIRGKALLFKEIAKNADVTRTEFHMLPGPLNLAQAVALAEQAP